MIGLEVGDADAAEAGDEHERAAGADLHHLGLADRPVAAVVIAEIGQRHRALVRVLVTGRDDRSARLAGERGDVEIGERQQARPRLLAEGRCLEDQLLERRRAVDGRKGLRRRAQPIVIRIAELEQLTRV